MKTNTDLFNSLSKLLIRYATEFTNESMRKYKAVQKIQYILIK